MVNAGFARSMLENVEGGNTILEGRHFWKLCETEEVAALSGHFHHQ